jgi:hypothetical protein
VRTRVVKLARGPIGIDLLLVDFAVNEEAISPKAVPDIRRGLHPVTPMVLRTAARIAATLIQLRQMRLCE